MPGHDAERFREPARGARDAAALLPLVAALLLTPPLVLIFDAPAEIAGVPLTVLYVFGVWAAVIIASAMLARRLGRLEPQAEGDEEAGG